MNWNLGYCCRCGNTEGPWVLRNNRWFCEECDEKESNPIKREKQVLKRAIHEAWSRILEEKYSYTLPFPENDVEEFTITFGEYNEILKKIREDIEKEIEDNTIWDK